MSSDPEQVQTIFGQAVRKPESERAEFLDRACGGDSELRRRVEALIEAHEHSGSFLDSPPKDLAGTSPTVVQSAPEQAGSLIGPYKLLQQIGEGGMGSVYMAEQIEPVERRVALKIIKPGMDTKAVIARFEAERQALAMMDHPNIAKVLDVGTTNSGRPYFVMELVRGVPITQYCDEHQLTPRQRLELFLPVCQAVQHAHQKGIIHRDIKPSNVLVAEYDNRPVPKIIDFGLAKAMEKRLTAKTMFTEFGQIVGTPDYMSPEQAKLNHLDIDTRSDIYSLGVLLYELLSGNTPFDRQRMRSAAFDELLRIIREEEPPKPSQRLSTVETLPSIAANRHITPAELTRQLSGELDWIVMKTLEKDRSRRYDTANGLANDIRRFLDDEPVEACPPSAAYRLRKFARRNKGPFTAAAAVALLLLAAAIVSTLAAVKFNRLADDNATLASERIVALDVAEKNLRLATVEQERAEGNLDLAMAALDAVYLDSIGKDKLLGEPVAKPDNEGRHQEVKRTPLTKLERDLLERGLEFYDQFAAQNASTPRVFDLTARAYYRVALLQKGLGETDSAESAFRAAIERHEKLTIERPHDWTGFHRLGEVRNGLAFVLRDWSDSKTQWTAAVKDYTKAIELRPEDALLWFERSQLHFKMGDFVAGAADLEKALKFDPDNVQYLKSALGRYKGESKFSPEYIAKTRDILERLSALAGEDPSIHIALGKTYQNPLHDREKSLMHFNRAVELSPNSAITLAHRAGMHSEFRDDEQALIDAERALDLDDSCMHAYMTRATFYVRSGQPEKALADFARAEELDPYYVHLLHWRGDLLLSLGNVEGALADFNLEVEINPRAPYVRKRRAAVLFRLGRYEEALADLKYAVKRNPKDTSTLVQISPTSVAQCKDESFKSGMIALADQLVETSDRKRSALVARSQLLIALGVNDRARQDLEQATVEFSQAAPSFDECYQRYSAALLSLQMGDNKKYREALQAMQQRFTATEEPKSQNFVAWTACLVPDAVEDYSTVLALAEKAVTADPENDQYQKTLAGLRYRAGEHDAAHELLIQIVQRDENPDAKANSSPAYTWYFLAMAEQALGHEMEARTFLHKAEAWTDRKLSGIQPLSWNRKLTLELLRDEAEASLGLDATDREELIAAFYADPPPADPDAQYWVDRGKWHHGRQEHEKSFADFTEAIRIAPSLRTAFDLRALAENCLGKHEEAILDATEAIRLEPNAAYAYEQRGWAYNELVHYEDAIVDLSEAIRLNPSFYFAYVRRHRACVAVGKQDMALADAKKIIELGPAAAILHEKKTRWRQAAEVYQTLLRLQPNDSRYWQRYANALLASGQSEQRRDFCAELIEQFGQTSDPDVALEIILCLIIVPDAVDDWSVPLRLGELLLASEKPKKLGVIGLLMRAGEYQRAIQLSREANQEAGGKLKSILCLWTGLAHHGLGELDEAKRMLSQAKERESESPYMTDGVQYQMLYRELADLVGEEVHDETEP